MTRRDPLTIGGAGLAPARGKTFTSDGLRVLHDARSAALIAALVGMALGWAITEVFNIADSTQTSKSGLHANAGLWTGLIGLCMGGTIMAFDHAVQGAWDSAARKFAAAAIPMFAVGFVSGYLASIVYVHFVEQITSSGDFSFDDPRFYLVRAGAWGIFGAGIGAAIGLVNRSQARAINGAVGGFAGGALGGVIFQYTGLHLASSSTTARLLGLMAIGALIALATRAVESARREAWLRVLGGGMTGKEFILYHPTTRIGASPECEIFLLKDPSVAKLHAQIAERAGERILSANTDAPVYVNQSPVTQHRLRNGDQVQIGNTIIGYAERTSPPAAAASAPGQW